MKSEDSKTFYRQVVEFKGMLRSKIKHLEKVPLMKTFPDNPHDLPEEVFNRVFPEDLQPVQDCTATLGLSAGLPSRKSHGSVKEKRKQPLPETMAAAMPEGAGMMQMMWQMLNMMQHQNTSADPLGLEVFASKRRKAPKAIMDKENEDAANDPAAGGISSSTAMVPKSPPTTTPRLSAPEKSPESTQSTPPAPEKKAFVTSPEGTKGPEEYVADLQAALKSREKSRTAMKQDDTQDDEGDVLVMKKPAAKAKSTAKKKEEDKESKEVDIAAVKKIAAKPKTGAKSAPQASASKGKAKAKPKATDKSEDAKSAEAPMEDGSELPPPPVPWNGTFFWKGGKIHKNPKSTSWRCFVSCSDRNDFKIKFGDDETASFHRALRLIEEKAALRQKASDVD